MGISFKIILLVFNYHWEAINAIAGESIMKLIEVLLAKP